jgi:hypothetical protein
MQNISNKHPRLYTALKYAIPATLTAGIVGFGLHVFLLQATQPAIEHLMQGIHISQPPYSPTITFFAGITALLPVAGLVLLYYWFGQYLPAQTRVGKGLWLGFMVLFIKGDLLRQPFMDLLVGNPWKVVLLQNGQIFVANLAVTIAIALIMPCKTSSLSACPDL